MRSIFEIFKQGKTAPTRLPLKALHADPVHGDYLPIIADANRLRFLVDLKNGKFEDKDAFMALLTGQKVRHVTLKYKNKVKCMHCHTHK